MLPLHHPAHKVERRTRIRTEISTSKRCSPHRAFVAEPARWSFGGSAVTMTVTPMRDDKWRPRGLISNGMYSRPKHSSQSLCTDSNRDLASNGLPHTWDRQDAATKVRETSRPFYLRGPTRFPRSGRICPCKASGQEMPLRNVVSDPLHSLLDWGGCPPLPVVTRR